MVVKEPLVVPFALLLCFPPVAVLLVFASPVLLPVLTMNALKALTFTSAGVWKEGLESGRTLEQLIKQASGRMDARQNARPASRLGSSRLPPFL